MAVVRREINNNYGFFFFVKNDDDVVYVRERRVHVFSITRGGVAVDRYLPWIRWILKTGIKYRIS